MMHKRFVYSDEFYKLLRESFDIPEYCSVITLEAASNGLVTLKTEGVLRWKHFETLESYMLRVRSALKSASEYRKEHLNG